MARPYFWRLSSLSLVIWPSVWPLLQGVVRAVRTAALSRRRPAARERSSLFSASLSQTSRSFRQALFDHIGEPTGERPCGGDLRRDCQEPFDIGALELAQVLAIGPQQAGHLSAGQNGKARADPLGAAPPIRPRRSGRLCVGVTVVPRQAMIAPAGRRGPRCLRRGCIGS